MTLAQAFDLLPERMRRSEEDVEAINSLSDVIARNSRWSSEDVAMALCKLVHWMCGTPDRRRAWWLP